MARAVAATSVSPLNVKRFDATGDEMGSQGWTRLIQDYNGNGVATSGQLAPRAPGQLKYMPASWLAEVRFMPGSTGAIRYRLDHAAGALFSITVTPR